MDESLPPLSPSMERVFSEALADLTEMERENEFITVKMELATVKWLQNEEDESILGMATPPPFTTSQNQDKMSGMSPGERYSMALKSSLEAKRARRSAIEKKSRQRRQGMLQRMREEVKQLEKVYDKKKMEIVHVNPIQEWIYSPSMTTTELERKYSELLMATHAMEEDQTALRELLETHEVFQQTIETFANERQAENAVWDDGIPPSSSFSVKFCQLSPAQCFTIVRETYQEIQRFSESDSFQSTGASFMGWTDKRKYDSELQALQFGFTKHFPLDSPEELLARTWEIFTNASKMAEMSFDSSVRTRFEVLQVLNENLIILRRDHKIPSVSISFAAVQVIYRLQTPTGYALCMRTISAPEIERAMEPHEYFYDVFHWYKTRFNRMRDGNGNFAGCEIMSGGSIKDQNQLKSTYWLFEIMCSVLRWEHACVAPLLLKQI